MENYDFLVDEIVSRIKSEKRDSFVVEASGRHIHLDRKAIDALFGTGYQLTKAKDLSQPGQFACKERIMLVGPKGVFENVVILGPERNASQVEISKTDTRVLGINAPIRESGHIEGTPGAVLVNGNHAYSLDQGVIVAKRHVHMTPEDAQKQNVSNGEIVQVKVQGERPLIFDDVVIRVHPKFATFMHIDFDEANACGLGKGTLGTILKK